jgi:hypothetical protein
MLIYESRKKKCRADFLLNMLNLFYVRLFPGCYLKILNQPKCENRYTLRINVIFKTDFFCPHYRSISFYICYIVQVLTNDFSQEDSTLDLFSRYLGFKPQPRY